MLRIAVIEIRDKFSKGIIYFGLFIFTALGMKWSVDQYDPTMLARVGALIVVFGIYLTWVDLSQPYAQLKEYLFHKASKRGKLTPDDEETNKWLHNEIERTRELDALVLAYGTILWGWGDLLMIWSMHQ